MNAIPLTWYLMLAALLFVIGLFGVLTRRHAIGALLGVELMLNAVNINLLAFWRHLHGTAGAQVFVLIIITVAAAEAAVGLALILNVYRVFHTVDVDEINLMKG